MDEIKNEKKITIYMDDVPSNYLESITDLSFIGYNIREHKNGIFYIPITPKKLDKYNLLSPTVFIKFPFTPECFYKEVDTMFRDDNITVIKINSVSNIISFPLFLLYCYDIPLINLK